MFTENLLSNFWAIYSKLNFEILIRINEVIFGFKAFLIQYQTYTLLELDTQKKKKS